MNDILLHLLKSSLSLLAFYLFYMAALRKETCYSYNRAFLLFSGIFSLAIPFVNFSVPESGYTDMVKVYLSPVAVRAGLNTDGNMLSIPAVILSVYIFVAALLLLKALARLIRIYMISRSSRMLHFNGHKTVLTSESSSPFSFFNTVFVPEDKLHDSDMDCLFSHEAVHARNLHSADILLFEMITIIQWFNPAAWLMKKELTAQHEFYADSEAVKSGMDITEYKNLLFAYSFRLSGNSLTNNFNSLLKRRLQMLTTKRPDNSGKIKLLFSIPVLLVLFLLFGSMNFAANTITDSQAGNSALLEDDKAPSFPGGESRLKQFAAENLYYPNIAKLAGITGAVTVSFTVESDGKIKDIQVVKGLGAGCDEAAVDLVKKMPDWIPGVKNGRPAAMKVELPVQFG